MRDSHHRYTQQLRQAAKSGVEALRKKLQARLLHGDGPSLTQDDNTVLDLVVQAYDESEEQLRQTMLSAFKEELRQFSSNLLSGKKCDSDTTTMAGYSLSFFGALERFLDLDNDLERILCDFVGNEGEFERLAEAPRQQTLEDLYSQILWWYFECLKDSKLFRSILERHWRSDASKGLERNSLLLIAAAEFDAANLGVDKLFLFFRQSVSLKPEERLRLLERTFFTMGLHIKPDALPSLSQSLIRHCNIFSHPFWRQEATEQKMFIDFLGFLFQEDSEAYRHLKTELEQIQEKRKHLHKKSHLSDEGCKHFSPDKFRSIC